MKIGILTFHRVINYGAQLQAYALQKFLRINNYNAFIVDYWPNYRKNTLKYFSWNYFKSMGFGQKWLYLRRQLTFFSNRKRLRNTKKFVESHMLLSDMKKYDTLICGSDQIWRKIKFLPYYDFDDTYFGQGKYNGTRVISYAASMGNVHFASSSDELKFQRLLKNIDAISVREHDLQDYILTHCKLNSQLVLDPVFLLNKDEWSDLIDESYIPKFKYILYYNHQGIKKTSYFVNNLSKKYNCKVVEILPAPDLFKWGSRYKSTADAQEFLSLLYGAEYVVSSSFHGFALAIRLGKQVYFDTNSKKSNRLLSLAKKLKLESQNISSIIGDKIPFINYDEVNLILDKWSQDSKNWLLQSLTSTGSN